jgi:hypothetical protein
VPERYSVPEHTSRIERNDLGRRDDTELEYGHEADQLGRAPDPVALFCRGQGAGPMVMLPVPTS